MHKHITYCNAYDYVTARAYEYNMVKRFAETCWEDNDNEASRTATDHSSHREDEVQVKVLQQGATTLVLPVLRFANASPHASKRTSAHARDISSFVHLSVHVNPSQGHVRIDLALMVPKSRLLFEPTEKKFR